MAAHHQPELRIAILAAIEAGDQRTEEISAATGIPTKGVSSRLCYMRELGLVNSVATKSARNSSINIWRLGPAPELGVDAEVHSKADERLVVIKTTYPADGKRDPLVAALFGAPASTRHPAPKQGAPRCCACGVEQGAQHRTGCIVPMVAA